MKQAISPESLKEDEDAKEPDEYQVKNAADDIMRAEEHKQNKKLMKHVHKHLATKAKAIQSVQDLRDTYAEKFGDTDNKGSTVAS